MPKMAAMTKPKSSFPGMTYLAITPTTKPTITALMSPNMDPSL